jgi:hypothetical protein
MCRCQLAVEFNIVCLFRYAKLVLWNGRVQGALFVSLGDGEHDIETFENLILSQVILACLRSYQLVESCLLSACT